MAKASQLQITSESVAPLVEQLTIVVPPARLDAAERDAAQRMARSQRIAGYRPGKVPARRIAALVGEDALREEAIGLLQEQVVREAVRQQGLVPSAPVGVDLATREPLTFVARVPLTPTVDLGHYAALEIETAEPDPVSDEDVDAVVEDLRRDMATLTPVDRPAEAGDVVTLALVGRDGDKVVFEDEALSLRLDRDEIVDDAGLPPAVVDGLVGAAAGEQRTFDVTYSEVWTQSELQGRAVAFEAAVSAVSGVTLPELDDAFAEEVATVDTLDALRAQIRRQLGERGTMAARDATVERAVDALIESAEVVFPQPLLDMETAGLVAGLRERVERQGLAWERWLELQDKTEDALWADAAPEAEERLVRRLVLDAFVRAEGIAVSDAEVEAETRRMTALFKGPARRGLPSEADLRRETGSRMLSRRVVDRLLEIVAPAADGPAADSE